MNKQETKEIPNDNALCGCEGKLGKYSNTRPNDGRNILSGWLIHSIAPQRLWSEKRGLGRSTKSSASKFLIKNEINFRKLSVSPGTLKYLSSHGIPSWESAASHRNIFPAHQHKIFGKLYDVKFFLLLFFIPGRGRKKDIRKFYCVIQLLKIL